MIMNNNTNIMRGKVYWADLGKYNGHIQGGVRPVIIIQNDIGNEHSPTTIVVPCSTSRKIATPCHYYFKLNGNYTIALCEQILTINKNQLKGYITSLNSRDMKILSSKICRSLGYEREKI